MANANLIKIGRNKLPQLRSLFAKNGKESLFAKVLINNYIRWFEKDPDLEYVNFFCLNGDFSDGTFVVTDRTTAYADTLNKSPDNLNRLLCNIDYSKGYMFRTIRTAIRPTILNALQSVNIEITDDEKGFLYFLPKAGALKLDTRIPEKVQLKPLTELHDFEKINSFWPHQNPDSIFMIQRLAHFNMNLGAFLEDGTLVAWIFRYLNGLMGRLQADNKYAGKGYGSFLFRAFTKMVAATGDDVYFSTDLDNSRIHSLADKCGFKCIGEDYDIYTKISQFSDNVGFNKKISKKIKI